MSGPMVAYVGTKMLDARPMTLGEYNNYRGWDKPENEDGDAPGYLVEYHDGGAPNHSDHKGYISWSPADIFERSYLAIGTAEIIGDKPPHVQRMIAESALLRDKVTKLGEYMKTHEFRHLPLITRELMKAQLPTMMAYLNLLDSRTLLG